MADWLKIKHDYIYTDTSYRALAKKYNVNKDTIARRAKAEGWIKTKGIQADRIQTVAIQKTADVLVAREVDRIGRINTLADRLIAKLEEAAGQLDRLTVANRVKSRTVTYDKAGRPLREMTTEQVQPTVKETGGLIDRQGLKTLTAALKDLQAISDGNQPTKNTTALMEELIDVMKGNNT